MCTSGFGRVSNTGNESPTQLVCFWSTKYANYSGHTCFPPQQKASIHIGTSWVVRTRVAFPLAQNRRKTGPAQTRHDEQEEPQYCGASAPDSMRSLHISCRNWDRFGHRIHQDRHRQTRKPRRRCFERAVQEEDPSDDRLARLWASFWRASKGAQHAVPPDHVQECEFFNGKIVQ